MATSKKIKSTIDFEVPERLAISLRDSKTIYMGPCVIQAPGAWSRMGPTWIIPGVGWITFGPGLAEWGTTQGLAQLARDPSCTPKFHALGWSNIPNPNIAFSMEKECFSSKFLSEVAEITRMAYQWEKDGRP